MIWFEARTSSPLGVKPVIACFGLIDRSHSAWSIQVSFKPHTGRCRFTSSGLSSGSDACSAFSRPRPYRMLLEYLRPISSR